MQNAGHENDARQAIHHSLPPQTACCVSGCCFTSRARSRSVNTNQPLACDAAAPSLQANQDMLICKAGSGQAVCNTIYPRRICQEAASLTHPKPPYPPEMARIRWAMGGLTLLIKRSTLPLHTPQWDPHVAWAAGLPVSRHEGRHAARLGRQRAAAYDPVQHSLLPAHLHRKAGPATCS